MPADALALMDRSFRERIRAPRVWSWVAMSAPRFALAAGTALVVGFLLFATLAWGPAWLARPALEAKSVHDGFGRFVAAVATTSAIAVSVATLAVRRELHGLQKLREREETNREFRERVRVASGRATLPLSFSGLLAAGFAALASVAADARAAAGEHAAALRVEGVALRDHLDAMERAATRTARALERAGARPHAIAEAALDFEEEVASHFTRAFARHEGAPEGVRAAMRELDALLCDVLIGAKHAKTLAMQWGFSRMSTAIALTSLPAMVATLAMVLFTGEGSLASLARWQAGLIEGSVLAIVFLPLACFASYTLRFVFLNEYTLPTDSFVLGPEEPDVVRGRDGAPARSAARDPRRRFSG